MKLETLDTPTQTPIQSYEAERAAYEKQREETLEWTFKRHREGQLLFEDRLVASLKPSGLIGYIKYKARYQGIPIILANTSIWGKNEVTIHALGPESFIGRLLVRHNKTVFVCNDGIEYILSRDRVGLLDTWWFIAPDGRKMAVTKADFKTYQKSTYTFRILDIKAEDPNRWLLAILSLYNILRFHYPPA